MECAFIRSRCTRLPSERSVRRSEIVAYLVGMYLDIFPSYLKLELFERSVFHGRFQADFR